MHNEYYAKTTNDVLALVFFFLYSVYFGVVTSHKMQSFHA